MFVYNQEQPIVKGAPGVNRKVLAHDEGLMVCEFLLEKDHLLAKHSHPHKQITYVISGHLRYTVGDEVREVKDGDSVLIQPDVLHEVFVLEDTKVIDVFTPAREDFL